MGTVADLENASGGDRPKGFGILGDGSAPPFWERGAGSPSNTMSLGTRPTSLPIGILIHPAIWPQQTWAKNWGLCPFGGGGAGYPSGAMWLGLRPIVTCN